MRAHRQLITTLTTGAALAGPLSLHAAMEIARGEFTRRGLAGIYQVSALYADSDRQTEGAAFAVIARMARGGRAEARRLGKPARVKLLVHHDGGTTLRSLTLAPTTEHGR
jgi:hypothetical protein